MTDQKEVPHELFPTAHSHTVGRILPPKEMDIFIQATAGLPSLNLPLSHVLNLINSATVCVFIQLVYKYTLTSIQPLFTSRDLGPLKKTLFFASGR